MSRLFHTLVVVGASLSIASCGGKSGRDRDGDEGSSGGAPSGGSGGTGGTGSGGVLIATGGVAATEDGGALPDQATLSQWSCAGLFDYCSVLDGQRAWLLRTHCPVDARRPREAADCAEDESYQCHRVSWRSEVALLVNCDCVSRPDAGCAECPTLQGPDYTPAVYCDESTTLCGCAVTGIT